MLSVSHLRRPGLSVAELTVADGECVAVTGPSGAGKTLLLRAIADLDPNTGEVTANGVERGAVSGPAWRRQVGFVAAESGWWADSVSAHFADPRRAEPLLDLVGLPAEALRWPVARLSSGEKQRLALIRALALEPKVLLLDEPTAALDEASKHQVERLLRAELQRGLSLLLVTHDAAQAKRLAKRQIRVERGRLQPSPQ